MEMVEMRNGKNGRVYTVKEGNKTFFYTADELCDKIGIRRDTLNQRIRVYGLKDSRVFMEKQTNTSGNSTGKKGSWGNLGTEPRKRGVFI